MTILMYKVKVLGDIWYTDVLSRQKESQGKSERVSESERMLRKLLASKKAAPFISFHSHAVAVGTQTIHVQYL